MSNKKIITEPTVENSPYLYSGGDKDAISFWFKKQDNNNVLIPTTFNGRKNVHYLSKKYCLIDDFPPVMRGMLLFLYILTMPITFGILVFLSFNMSRLLLDTVKENFNISDTMLIILSAPIYCVFALIPVLITWLMYDKGTNIVDEALFNDKYKFDRKDRKRISQDTFLLLSPQMPITLIENAHKINKQVNTIFSFDEDTIEHVDTTELQYYYDDYMRLLSFVSTNHDNISNELMQRYLNKIKEKTIQLNNIIQEIISLEKQYNENLDQIEKYKLKLQQEMLDDDALRAHYVE